MKIDDISVWQAFREVAKQGHFSRAAVNLRVPLPQVSKKVSKLEVQLGVRLFHRTTRIVTLTDEGWALLPKVERLLADFEETEAYFEKKQNYSGSLKITAVPFVAQRLLLPVLHKFMSMYPKLKIELDLNESFVNLHESAFDIALRIDTPKDSELVYRKLVPNDLVFCASPAYLKKTKTKLEKPADLHAHNLLMMSIHHRCKFSNSTSVASLESTVETTSHAATKLGDFKNSKIIECENGSFLTDMALAGMGVLVRSIWDVKGYLKKGTLVQVLAKHPLETFGHIHAVVPTRRFVAPRVRAFLDFIIGESKGW